MSNLSEQDICLVFFSYQLSQSDSWLICFNRHSLPCLADSSAPGCVRRVVAGELQCLADEQSLRLLPPFHLLPSPKYPRTPTGNREGTGRTQTSGVVRNKASGKLTRMMYESRRQAVGRPNEQRVVLIALGKSKETNKSH